MRGQGMRWFWWPPPWVLWPTCPWWLPWLAKSRSRPVAFWLSFSSLWGASGWPHLGPKKSAPKGPSEGWVFFFKAKVETKSGQTPGIWPYPVREMIHQISMNWGVCRPLWDHRKPTRNSRNGPCRMRAVAAVDQFILLSTSHWWSPTRCKWLYGCRRYTATRCGTISWMPLWCKVGSTMPDIISKYQAQ